jgi:tetratricopeptide (TPR) repeat protein
MDARLWHNLAIAYIDLGMPSEAIGKLKRAIDLDPNFQEARYNLALLYEDIEDIDNSMEQLEKAIETSGSSEIYEKHLATMLVRASRYEEAREYVEHVLLTEPEEPEMLGDMIIILHGTGDFAGAAGYYQRLKATGADLGDKWLDKVVVDLRDFIEKEE